MPLYNVYIYLLRVKDRIILYLYNRLWVAQVIYWEDVVVVL